MKQSDDALEAVLEQKVALAANPAKQHVGLNVCVFCSARDLPAIYTEPTEELARLLAEHGHTLVWGGSAQGLMQIMADGVKAGGAKIIGVSVKYLIEKMYKGADEMTIAEDLGERKAAMLARSDVIVSLVGGIGTLDELTEVIELRRHDLHTKPIIILDTDNFYAGLRLQLERMAQEGFLTRPLEEIVYFAQTPADVISRLDEITVRSQTR